MPTTNEYIQLIEESLKNTGIPNSPEELYKPIQYILGLGGKRIRPLLTLMSAGFFSPVIETAMPAAMAIEIFHNFTLLHDDIMDKADIRRGKPTVHKIWGENTAILSGDAAMILAYEQLNRLPEKFLCPVMKVFNQTALQVCEGQQLDMNFEKRNNVQLHEYLEMIRLKTSVLLAASMKIGGICAGADNTNLNYLYEIGLGLGMAFQLQDDYLDTFADEIKFGKTIGGDIINNKKTYLLISALNSENKNLVKELKKWIEMPEFDRAEKINAIKNIYCETGVNNDIQLAAIGYINNAVEVLNQIDTVAQAKKPLEEILFSLMYREK
ncbi:MAG: polyprenyl synthetase family protein [Bacteroidales bacterium]|nr:polyprenyl synthetase family protein [Bacteroidales bacterium]